MAVLIAFNSYINITERLLFSNVYYLTLSVHE